MWFNGPNGKLLVFSLEREFAVKGKLLNRTGVGYAPAVINKGDVTADLQVDLTMASFPSIAFLWIGQCFPYTLGVVRMTISRLTWLKIESILMIPPQDIV